MARAPPPPQTNIQTVAQPCAGSSRYASYPPPSPIFPLPSLNSSFPIFQNTSGSLTPDHLGSFHMLSICSRPPSSQKHIPWSTKTVSIRQHTCHNIAVRHVIPNNELFVSTKWSIWLQPMCYKLSNNTEMNELALICTGLSSAPVHSFVALLSQTATNDSTGERFALLCDAHVDIGRLDGPSSNPRYETTSGLPLGHMLRLGPYTS